MQIKGIKAIEIMAVMVSLIVGFIFYQHFQPEILSSPGEETVDAAQIKAAPWEAYSGKMAGEGILHLKGREDLEGVNSGDHAVINTKELIATDVYGLKSWVDPYSLTKRRITRRTMVSTGKRAAQVRKGPGWRPESYQEYYLVRLPDASYCFARIPEAYVRQLKQDGEITLPIGQKRNTSQAEQSYLTEIGSDYGADPSYLLYMVDDGWGEKTHFMFFLIRFGAAAVLFFLLAVGSIMILGKKEPL